MEYKSEVLDVLRLIQHIENPCSVEVKGKVMDIRRFYLRLADEMLFNLENPFAGDMLKEYIDKYKKRE